MAAISVAAEKRHGALTRALKALDMERVSIPTTKANPIESEAFYAEILAVLANHVVAQARRIDAQAESIDNLSEALAVILNRESRKAESESPEGEAD